jgi:hypothetical protein
MKMVIGICVRKNIKISKSNGLDSRDFVAMSRSDLHEVARNLAGDFNLG